MQNKKAYILVILIFSQFACTSLWFAGNSILEPLMVQTGLGIEIMGYVLSSVQLGFIIGTLVFATFMVADRFSPSKVFFVCALLGALCNYSLLLGILTKWHLLAARFGTGFFLAGIYPVGMKIASDYYEKGLGKALGYLVGALVFGTSFPFFLSNFIPQEEYTIVIQTTTFMAVFGGVLIYFLVPNGPYRTASSSLQLTASYQLFKNIKFRKVAFGYFGHMWELYAFWAFTPLAMKTYNTLQNNNLPISLLTGIIIALGGLSCILGGIISQYKGSYKVAVNALIGSAIFCLLSPLFFKSPPMIFIIGWCIWGMAVTADSPQFSNLVAQAVPNNLKGTALTIVNCIGFTITIFSIELLSTLSSVMNANYLFLLLAIGPIIGIFNLKINTN